MYNFILFKNIRGSTKLCLRLSKAIDSLADLTDEQAYIINYVTNLNNYNFALSSKLDSNAIMVDEKAIYIEYCKENFNNGKKIN